MPTRVPSFLLSILCTCAALLAGEQTVSEMDARSGRAGPLREARSADGGYTLHVRRGSGAEGEARGCRASLVRRGARPGEEQEVWQGPLVNEFAPVYGLVRNDGRFTITLDEFRRGGARHALVVYGADGAALREFRLRELLRGADWAEVRKRGRALEWLGGAEFAFVDQPAEFHIRTRWNRTIRIDLERLEPLDVGGTSADDQPIPDDILALLEQRAPENPDQQRVARLADQLAMLLEQQPGDDAAGRPSPATIPEPSPPGVPVVAETSPPAAAVKPPAARETSAPQVESPPVAAHEDAVQPVDTAAPPAEADPPVEAAANAAPADAPTDESASLANVEASDSVAPQPEPAAAPQPAREAAAPPPAPEPAAPRYDPSGPAGVSAAAGIPVPMPDPARPVDYLAWANAQTRISGANAWSEYRAALASMKKYEGSASLLERALQGDALALGSRDVQEWLHANLGSMQRLSAGNALPYRGITLASEDGSLIGALLPHLGGMRELSKASILAGKLMESEGSYGGAADFYIDALASGANVGAGPTMIENLVGVAIQQNAADAMLDLYSHEAAGELDFGRIASKLEAAHRPLRPPVETVQFERAMVLDTLQSMYEYDASSGRYRIAPKGIERLSALMEMTGDGADDALDPVSAVLSLGGVGFESMVSHTNELYDRMTEAVQRPFPEAVRQLREVERELADPASVTRNPLLASLGPSLSRYTLATTRAEATRRATMAVTQLSAHRQQNGAYPDSLNALGEREFTLDPFTGEPFAYRRDGEAFSLYSRGANGTDEGGVHDAKGETNDIVYWPRPR
ncbi:MAG: hypothetical protein HRF50_02035 [Phycisphaerae bacterium]|jgi:tetratricopeptide (TPR) repeat protein